MRKLIIIIFCFSLLFVAGCSGINPKVYYATHPTPAEDVSFQWGEPTRVEQLENGAVKWVYFIKDPHLYGEYYFIIRDGMVEDFGVN
jgi:hypothetical protein